MTQIAKDTMTITTFCNAWYDYDSVSIRKTVDSVTRKYFKVTGFSGNRVRVHNLIMENDLVFEEREDV